MQINVQIGGYTSPEMTFGGFIKNWIQMPLSVPCDDALYAVNREDWGELGLG